MSSPTGQVSEYYCIHERNVVCYGGSVALAKLARSRSSLTKSSGPMNPVGA